MEIALIVLGCIVAGLVLSVVGDVQRRKPDGFDHAVKFPEIRPIPMGHLGHWTDAIAVPNEKFIVVLNADYDSVRKGAQDFLQLHHSNNSRYPLRPPMDLHRINTQSTLVTFPFDASFEDVCLTVNYLTYAYPPDHSYAGQVRGWLMGYDDCHFLDESLNEVGLMVYINPHDTEYDYVLIATEDGRNYIMNIGYDHLIPIDEQVLEYDPPTFNRSVVDQFEQERIK